MAIVAAGCVCTTSASSLLLSQTRDSVNRSREQQGCSISWSGRIQGNCSSSVVWQRSTASLQNEARGGVVCQVAVRTGDAQSSEGKETNIGPGTRIRVKNPLTVYHIVKAPNMNIEGLEGEVKEHIVEWKGKTVSATFPYKVQFNIEVDGKPVKFVAHLRDDEFEVVG